MDYDDFTFSALEPVNEMQGLLSNDSTEEATNPFAEPVPTTSNNHHGDTAVETDPYLISQQASPPQSPVRDRNGPMLGFREGKSDYNTPAEIEREETVKCVVSSLLFGAIVIAIFIVAFSLNPQMWCMGVWGRDRPVQLVPEVMVLLL